MPRSRYIKIDNIEMWFDENKISRHDFIKVYNLIENPWEINTYLHREDGPAFIQQTTSSSRIEKWIQNGSLHRLDGPAYKNGSYTVWFIHGIECYPEKMKDRVLSTNFLALEEVLKFLEDEGEVAFKLKYSGKK